MCCLRHSHRPNEQERGFCVYLNNRANDGEGHGRVDIRSIRVSSELKGYSDWPGLEQVFEIRRRFQSKGIWHEAVRYGVTSLPATIAIPERLLP